MAAKETKQFNIQISTDARRALKAAELVDKVSAVRLAAPVVERYAAKRSKEPAVAALIKALAASETSTKA